MCVSAGTCQEALCRSRSPPHTPHPPPPSYDGVYPIRTGGARNISAKPEYHKNSKKKNGNRRTGSPGNTVRPDLTTRTRPPRPDRRGQPPRHPDRPCRTVSFFCEIRKHTRKFIEGMVFSDNLEAIFPEVFLCFLSSLAPLKCIMAHFSWPKYCLQL